MQKRMADIVKEQGIYHWIQTPAKNFPLEPHFYFPFFAYFPLSFRTFLHTHFTLGFMGQNRNWLDARMMCEDTRLLTEKEMKALFPTSRIIKEYFFGMCKSYTATNML